MWDALRQDIRFAGRSFTRSPAFALTAILAIAVGIGANTAIFSLVDTLLVRLPPYADADRLVVFWEENPLQGARYNEVAPLSISTIRERARSFEQVAVYDYGGATLRGVGEPERLTGLVIDAHLFGMLGVEPMIGRNLAPGEDALGAAPVALISHGLWQRRFGGDPDVVGSTVVLNGPTTIIGVMPPDFHFAFAGDVWTPLVLVDSDWQIERRFLRTVAKLRPGVSIEQARAELNAIAAELERERPETREGWRYSLHGINDGLVQGPIRPMMLVLLGAVGFVLLIACADVANLLLARAAGRQREIAIRTALGAARGRLVRQLLTESLLLSLAGGVAGTLLATWALDLIRSATPAIMLQVNPRMAEIGVDARVLAWTAGLTIATGLLFGFLPALRASRPDLGDALKQGDRGSTAGRGQHGLRGTLVGLQAALAVVLLAGGTILMRNVLAQQAANPGLHTDRVIAMQVSPRDVATYDDPNASSETLEARLLAFHRAIIERIGGLPEIESVALTNGFPLSGEDFRVPFEIEGRMLPANDRPLVSTRAVTDGYHALIGVPLRSGRALRNADREGAAPVAIVSESFARAWLPGEDPLGKRITLQAWGNQPREIVGVVADVQDWRTSSRSMAMVYVPLPQFVMRTMFILARTRGEASAAAAGIRRAVFGVDAQQPVSSSRTMREVLEESTFDQRLISASMAVFALVALLLAVVGVYGVVSYAVNQRIHEFGIRMALGAQPRGLLRQVVLRGMSPVVVGLMLGTAGAFAISRVLARIVWAASGFVPTLGVAAVTLLTAALAAVALPAWRAARVDPIVALRID